MIVVEEAVDQFSLAFYMVYIFNWPQFTFLELDYLNDIKMHFNVIIYIILIVLVVE